MDGLHRRAGIAAAACTLQSSHEQDDPPFTALVEEMMRRSIPSLVMVLAFTLACTSGEDAGMQDTGAAGGAAGGGESVRVQLAALGESGVSGTVTVTPQGSGAAFAIHVMGTAGTYTAHVHQGTCADTTEPAVVADLGTVTVSEGGMVDHEATASVAADSLLNGQHYVGLHRDATGPHVACAELRR